MTSSNPGKSFIAIILCAALLTSVAATASAYILPARQILGFMIDQFGSGRTLVVFEKTVLYDPELEGGMEEFDQTLYYAFPDRFRSEVNSGEVEEIQVVNGEESLFVINGNIIGEAGNLFDHFKYPILHRKIDLLVDDLFRLQIDLETVSLGRFKNRIAYVIGAKYPDESVSQLWIDKENFAPIRFIVSGNQDRLPREIEYTDYKSDDKGRRYPGRILFYEDNVLVKMHVLEVFEVNAEVSDELFDVAYLRSFFGQITPSPPLTPPESELDEVKKSIQDFKKIFE